MAQNICGCSVDNCSKIADFISKKTKIRPTVAVICGSGLGSLAEMLEDCEYIKYKDIPNFPTSTVSGHLGILALGRVGEKQVAIMQGRFHWYEGYSRDQIVIPIRVLKLLGVKYLVLTNSAGGLNQELKCGHFVLLKDHISLPGLTLKNPLVGPNEDRLGPRFLAMSDVYDPELRKLAMKIASEQGLLETIREGVYVQVGGPTYESPAECRMLRAFGADVVGMSTVPEAMVAHHAQIRLFAISLVTNMSVLTPNSGHLANHEEVLQTALDRVQVLRSLIAAIISRIQ